MFGLFPSLTLVFGKKGGTGTWGFGTWWHWLELVRVFKPVSEDNVNGINLKV